MTEAAKHTPEAPREDWISWACKMEAQRDVALEPFAGLAAHYPLEGGYGNRPRTGVVYQVSSHGKPDAEITVEALHTARTALAQARKG